MTCSPTEEVVALFHAEPDLERALAALAGAGFGSDRLSLLASCEAVEKKLGHRYCKVAELEDRPEAPRVAYVPAGEESGYQNALIGTFTYVAAAFGVILASSGGLVPMLLAATAAGGTVASVGEVLKWLVGHDHLVRHQEQLEHGGLLLWVRVEDDAEASKAMTILRREGGDDVHTHTLSEPHGKAIA